jgi:hypothetical protein
MIVLEIVFALAGCFIYRVGNALVELPVSTLFLICLQAHQVEPKVNLQQSQIG